MAHGLPIPPPGFDELAVEQKVEYVEALWERIAATSEAVGVPDWHRELLCERLAEYGSDSRAGRPWREVREDLLRELVGRKRTTGS